MAPYLAAFDCFYRMAITERVRDLRNWQAVVRRTLASQSAAYQQGAFDGITAAIADLMVSSYAANGR